MHFIQDNFFTNPDNSALEESSSMTGSFDFYKKKSFISETGRSQGHDQEGLQESLYNKHCGIFSQLLSHFVKFFSYEESMKHRKGH
jgi:hypothetical protein